MLLSASGKPWAANPKSGALGADALIAVPPIISAPSLAPGAKAVRPTIGQRHFFEYFVKYMGNALGRYRGDCGGGSTQRMFLAGKDRSA